LGMFCLCVIHKKKEYHKDRSWGWPCLQSPSTVWRTQLDRQLLSRCVWTTSPSTVFRGPLSPSKAGLRALSIFYLSGLGRMVLHSLPTNPNIYISRPWEV
jgi:hypothetical protein